MPKTISFHNGTAWSRGHNVRDERYTDKQKHIDKALTEQNVTIRDVPVRQAYAEIFGQAVEEYNAKQKRSDRCITDYYDKIKRDKRKHPVYECIVQIGDRSDTGNAAEQEKQALIKFAEEWDKRNPNLRLVGAYIHCDEPDGTVHMHLDYIPVAVCTRGMGVQNSLDRALQQQGFKSENIHQTAQIAWQDSEREALCVICRDLGIDVQRNQGIGQGREYLTPQEYRDAKDSMIGELEQEKKRLEQEKKQLEQEINEITNYTEAKWAHKGDIVLKRQRKGRVTIEETDLDSLIEGNNAYVQNYKKIKDLDQACRELQNEKVKFFDERVESRRDKEIIDYIKSTGEYNSLWASAELSKSMYRGNAGKNKNHGHDDR